MRRITYAAIFVALMVCAVRAQPPANPIGGEIAPGQVDTSTIDISNNPLLNPANIQTDANGVPVSLTGVGKPADTTTISPVGGTPAFGGTTTGIFPGAGGGVGGGSIQFLFQAYGNDLTVVATQLVSSALAAVAPVFIAVASITIFLIGKRLAFANSSLDEAATRMVRLVIVGFLLVPTHYNSIITTNATQVIPQRIAGTINGTSQSIAQTLDNESKALTLFGAQARAQAPGLENIGERATIHAYVGLGKLWLWLTGFIIGIVYSVIPFLMPLGALLLIFFCFDATSPWAMRWIGKLLNLYLVLFLVLAVGAFVARVDGRYIAQYGVMLSSNASNPGFSLNAGDQAMQSIGLGGDLTPGVNEPTQPLGDGSIAGKSTANVSAAIETLENIATAFAWGFFVLALTTGVAGTIGSASGSVLSPVSAAVGWAVGRVMRR